MSLNKAWSLLSIAVDELQYGGNAGYEDQPGRSYKYDSEVANHLQLTKGDLVVVRDKDEVRGLALIQSIEITLNTVKNRQRCTQCGSTAIKARRSMVPKWRCHSCVAAFDVPILEMAAVTSYEAKFGKTFRSMQNPTPVSLIRPLVLRPSDQMSMAELDVRLLESRLIPLQPDLITLFQEFATSQTLSDEVGEQPSPINSENTYADSAVDTRMIVLKAILARRGQVRFRKALLKRYGASCMVSGCTTASVLEAAHIDPYRGDAHNHPENGLLLRSDLHTLFDLGLLAIEPNSLEIYLKSSLLQSEDYAAFAGSKLRIASNLRPSKDALLRRWTGWTS